MSNATKMAYNRYKKYSLNLRNYYKLPAVHTSLTLVLSLFICAFFILVALRPTFIAIAKLNTTIADSKKTLAQLNAKAGALQQAERVWEEIKQFEPQIERAIPSKGPAYPALVLSAEVLATSSNVQIASETIGPALTFSSIADPYTGKKRSVITIPYSVRVTGEYQNIMEFMRQLTNLDRMIQIDSLSIARDAEAEGVAQTLTLSVSAKTYIAADEQMITKILEELRGK